MLHLKSVLVVALCAFASGCLTEIAGEPGENGAPGPQGEQGPPGSRLVWKDVDGTILPKAIPEYEGAAYTLVMPDDNGVFFSFSPASGTPIYAEKSTGGSSTEYLTNNCTGPAHHSVDISPGVAFHYNGRIVALPHDIAVSPAALSYYWDGSCRVQTLPGAWIERATLDALPTLTPPVLDNPPYHVEWVEDLP